MSSTLENLNPLSLDYFSPSNLLICSSVTSIRYMLDLIILFSVFFTYGLSSIPARLCPALYCWDWLSANYISQAPLLHGFPKGSANGRHWWEIRREQERDFYLWHQPHGWECQLLVVVVLILAAFPYKLYNFLL